MKVKVKDIIITALSGLFIFGFFFSSFIVPDTDFLMAERRPAQEFPKFSIDSLMSGNFRTEFESYTQDQFPLRDPMRTLKALTALYGFRHLENNDYILLDGSMSKLDHTLRQDDLDYSVKTFDWVYENVLKDKNANLYLSIIPDKNYYMAEKGGYLALDYNKLIGFMKENFDFAKYIDITDTLELSDYYRTDSHWKQECITDTANRLANAMGTTLPAEYKEVSVYARFEGVYYKQAALPVKRDEIKYLSNNTLDALKLYSFDTGEALEIPLYDEEKATGRDGYEFFLHGRKGMQVIENPNASTDKELVVFRDSFGSSIAPLLAQGYRRVTLIDLRDFPRMTLRSMVSAGEINLENRDVLFLFSTTILNKSLEEGFK